MGVLNWIIGTAPFILVGAFWTYFYVVVRKGGVLHRQREHLERTQAHMERVEALLERIALSVESKTKSGA